MMCHSTRPSKGMPMTKNKTLAPTSNHTIFRRGRCSPNTSVIVFHSQWPASVDDHGQRSPNVSPNAIHSVAHPLRYPPSEFPPGIRDLHSAADNIQADIHASQLFQCMPHVVGTTGTVHAAHPQFTTTSARGIAGSVLVGVVISHFCSGHIINLAKDKSVDMLS